MKHTQMMKHRRQFRLGQGLGFSLAGVLVGVTVLVTIFASGTPIGFEAENGALSGTVGKISDATASGGGAIKFGPGTVSSQVLPFSLASTTALRSSSKKVFVHYWPPLPISLDNQDPTTDYYQRNYLSIGGESGKYADEGGYLRDRPFPQNPLICPIAGETSCTTGTSSTACPLAAPPSWKIANMKTEVRRAIKAGLDGFTLDIIQSQSGADYQVCQNAFLMLQAAHEVDPNFDIVLMPDMSSTSLKSLTMDELAAYIALLGSYPSAYHLPDGRLVVSPFYPDADSAHTASWWGNWESLMKTKYNITVAFVPCFVLSTSAEITAFDSVSYGFSNWGSGNPANNQNLASNITQSHSLGKIWMQPVRVQDVRPSKSIFDEANNSENLRTTLLGAIGTAPSNSADWIQIPTWNDYTEQANVAPSPHTGWSILDISDYYLSKFKTGDYPTITKDVLYISHRVQLSAALPTPLYAKPMVIRPSGSPARDTVEVLSYLTAPADITVHIGNSTATYQAPAGEYSKILPLTVGAISATALRTGTQVASVTSPFDVLSTFAQQDLQYHFVSSARLNGIGSPD
jgi:hypothetical protein